MLHHYFNASEHFIIAARFSFRRAAIVLFLLVFLSLWHCISSFHRRREAPRCSRYLSAPVTRLSCRQRLYSSRTARPNPHRTARQALKTKNEEIQANEAREEFAKERFEALAASIAKDAPDKADGYKSSGFEIKDIQSGTINGKSYDITGDIKTKVIEAANKKYYDDLARLENNEVNVEDIVGYTKKGKARTSTAMDGTEVSLTGKLYNEDGTPRFDSLVTSRIYLKAKESAKDSAINEYADEITGNATETHTESEESTKVSLVQKGSSGGSTKNSKYTFKGTSDGGSKKRSGLAGNASRGSSSYVNVTPATSDRELHSLAAASILNSQGIPNIGNNVYQIAAHNLIKNGKTQPIRANKIEPIKPLGLI